MSEHKTSSKTPVGVTTKGEALRLGPHDPSQLTEETSKFSIIQYQYTLFSNTVIKQIKRGWLCCTECVVIVALEKGET